MRTIIAGGRDCKDPNILHSAIINCNFLITTVLCGAAKGADTLGYLWAVEHEIPVEVYPAYWDVYGMAAGPIRNKQMAEKAEALIALWDGYSKGTANMITIARKLGLKVHVESY